MSPDCLLPSFCCLPMPVALYSLQVRVSLAWSRRSPLQTQPASLPSPPLRHLISPLPFLVVHKPISCEGSLLRSVSTLRGQSCH